MEEAFDRCTVFGSHRGVQKERSFDARERLGMHALQRFRVRPHARSADTPGLEHQKVRIAIAASAYVLIHGFLYYYDRLK